MMNIVKMPMALLSMLAMAAPWAQVAGEFGGMPPPLRPSKEIPFVAGIRIQDGAYRVRESISGRALQGMIGDDAAGGIRLTSSQDGFNALLVLGPASAYTVTDATIDLSGNGSNDFEGIAAGAMVADGATLTLRNVRITTNGVISSATTARENSVLRVYDSTLVAHGGRLPAGYVPKIGPGMMEAPAPLGLKGTSRTHLTMSNSKTYFYNSTIIADGWGTLSTDDTGGNVYLEANDCDIQVRNSGYGTYADFGATVVINNSKMKTATYTGIIAGSGKIVLNNVDGQSGGSAVMIHRVMGDRAEVASLTIKGGTITAKDALVLVKSANADVYIDSARLESGSGTLIRSVVNADPYATKVGGHPVRGVKATLKHATLAGDIVHHDTERPMTITFDQASLRGAIRNAAVSIDAGSRWTATKDSNLTLLDAVDIASIDAPSGVTISALGGTLRGRHVLASGGILTVKAE